MLRLRIIPEDLRHAKVGITIQWTCVYDPPEYDPPPSVQWGFGARDGPLPSGASTYGNQLDIVYVILLIY